MCRYVGMYVHMFVCVHVPMLFNIFLSEAFRSVMVFIRFFLPHLFLGKQSISSGFLVRTKRILGFHQFCVYFKPSFQAPKNRAISNKKEAHFGLPIPWFL